MLPGVELIGQSKKEEFKEDITKLCSTFGRDLAVYRVVARAGLAPAWIALYGVITVGP
jgi:hypothetical protein